MLPLMPIFIRPLSSSLVVDKKYRSRISPCSNLSKKETASECVVIPGAMPHIQGKSHPPLFFNKARIAVSFSGKATVGKIVIFGMGVVVGVSIADKTLSGVLGVDNLQ